MNPSQKLYWLIGGVVALLIVASAIGHVLRARVKDEAAAAVVADAVEVDAVASRLSLKPSVQPLRKA